MVFMQLLFSTTVNINSVFFTTIFLFGLVMTAVGQSVQPVLVNADNKGETKSITSAAPLDKISLVNAKGKSIQVSDGKGNIYFSAVPNPVTTFTVSGSLGKHVVTIKDKKNNSTEVTFLVDAQTKITDGGRYEDMFNLFYTSMQTDTGHVTWNGKRYRYFVPWGLDHCHTMKGLKYFYNFGDEFVDLMRNAQREDGMIWSFVEHMPNMDYFRTRDSWSGYTQKIGDKYFVRQPTENHPEYIFVKTIYQWWKASGNDAWMKLNLAAAAKALDYCMHDPARWSKRFQLLKRVYTIDSWDFQVDDKYTPNLGLTNTMTVDPEKSKFGIFFGDNTAYVMACRQLAEMYEHNGQPDEGNAFRERADAIEKRLNALSWNGKFYTHFIEEDSTVKRDLGVDEKSQLAQSNAYSLNRGLDHDKSKAIIESYLNLKRNLPVGSPGEWYAIYPPFERGFEIHGAKWQYMNGGVGGHVAGELARGAFEHGYENYATDILERLYELGKKYNNKIYFAYTGSIPPPPPPPTFKPVDLSNIANMDFRITSEKNTLSWMNSKRIGDDFQNLPTGDQTFQGTRFQVIDPSKNNGRAVVAVAKQKGFPPQKEIPINDKAGALYFLHTSSKPSSENVSGAVSLHYSDGTQIIRYMIMDKHLTYWWFSNLKTDHSGIAWYGANEVSKGIGLSWCALDNPHPDKIISKIVIHSAEDETIYTVFAISLSDQKHFVPVQGPSFGGPDNWAAATAMAALVEGLAGVKDSPGEQAFGVPTLSPRWNETKADTVNVTIRYAASDGYVSYKYYYNPSQKAITLLTTGNALKMNCHILLPENTKPISVHADQQTLSFKSVQIEKSTYVDFSINPSGAKHLVIRYE
jgi:hypothetical protein